VGRFGKKQNQALPCAGFEADHCVTHVESLCVCGAWGAGSALRRPPQGQTQWPASGQRRVEYGMRQIPCFIAQPSSV